MWLVVRKFSTERNQCYWSQKNMLKVTRPSPRGWSLDTFSWCSKSWMLRALTCLISVNPRELSAYLRMECDFFTCFLELVLPPCFTSRNEKRSLAHFGSCCFMNLLTASASVAKGLDYSVTILPTSSPHKPHHLLTWFQSGIVSSQHSIVGFITSIGCIAYRSSMRQ